MSWRPAPAWLPAGLILGAPCGALVGTVLIVIVNALDKEPALALAELGLFYGGVAGGAVGLVVGFVMTFLGGSHLPGQQARERAFVVAFCSTGLLLFVPLGAWFLYLGLAAAFVSALAAGTLSYWLTASLDMRTFRGD